MGRQAADSERPDHGEQGLKLPFLAKATEDFSKKKIKLGRKITRKQKQKMKHTKKKRNLKTRNKAKYAWKK